MITKTSIHEKSRPGGWFQGNALRAQILYRSQTPGKVRSGPGRAGCWAGGQRDRECLNHLHHLRLPPLCPQSAPTLPPLPKQPLTRMVAGFRPFAPTAPTFSAGSSLEMWQNVPGVGIRRPAFSFSAPCPFCVRLGSPPTTASIWRGLQGRLNGGKQLARRCVQRGQAGAR